MDEARRLAGSNVYLIQSQCTDDAEGTTRHTYTCKSDGSEHQEVIAHNKLDINSIVEETAPQHHPVPLLRDTDRLPRDAPSLAHERVSIHNNALSPTVAEHATRGRRLASKNVSKVVQMFKSDSQNILEETSSPRHACGEHTRKRSRSPACEARTPRSRLNPATPSTPSPPPAGGSGHTASTAVAADRLVGEEPISSTEITAGVRSQAVTDGGDDRQRVRYPGYEGVNTSDPRYKVTEHSQGGVVEGKPSEGKPKLALLFDGPEHEYQDEYNWRKYGKKPIKGYVNPRFYWRCTFDGCGVQRHTQLLTTGNTEVLYDGCHCHLPPPAKAARGRGRGRVAAEVPPAIGRALDAALTRDTAGAHADSARVTSAGNCCGIATRAASSGAAAGPSAPPAAAAVEGLATNAAAPALADEENAHGEAAAKRKALFMRSARMKAPTAAAMMSSPAEEDDEDAPPTKRVRATSTEAFPQNAASPRAASGGSPPVAAGVSTRPSLRHSAGVSNVRSPRHTPSQHNAAAGRQSMPRDAQNLSRCPLYFLACVAAKEKFTSSA